MSYKLKVLDVDQIARLSFPKKACNYIYVSQTAGKVVGLAYNTDKSTYEALQKILIGDPEAEVKKEDKVFVLPGHSFAKARIKEFLKNEGATLTDDITKATVIAGSKNFSEKTSGQAAMTSIMFEAGTVYMMNKNVPKDLSVSFGKMHDDKDVCDKIWTDWEKEKMPCVLSTLAYNNIGFDANLDLMKNKSMITAQGMEIIYHIFNNKLPVLTEEYITENAHSNTKLEDDSVFEGIWQMLESGDKDSQKMGVELLIHSDISGDTYYKLWRLAREFGGTIQYHDRSKSVQQFVEAAEWNILRQLSEMQFLIRAKKNGTYTEQMSKEVLPMIIDDIKDKLDYLNEEELQFFSMNVSEKGVHFDVKDAWYETENVADHESISL